MKGLFSRKQFFAETLRQGLKLLSRCIDGDDARSNCAQTDHSSNCGCISPDFSPTLLRQEARRLGIDPGSFDNEELLQTVYDAMKAQHYSTGDTKYEQTCETKNFHLLKGAKPMKHIRNLVDFGDNF